MASRVTCPSCGEECSLQRKFDAWACYEIVGVAENGTLSLSEDYDTQVFDDNHIECSNCDEQFEEDEIVQHLNSKEETGEVEE